MSSRPLRLFRAGTKTATAERIIWIYEHKHEERKGRTKRAGIHDRVTTSDPNSVQPWRFALQLPDLWVLAPEKGGSAGYLRQSAHTGDLDGWFRLSTSMGRLA